MIVFRGATLFFEQSKRDWLIPLAVLVEIYIHASYDPSLASQKPWISSFCGLILTT